MLDFTDYPTLHHAYVWSTKMFDRMESSFMALEGNAPEIMMIAASGSLGRLEGMEHSDCDLIIIVKNEIINHPKRCNNAMQEVWDAIGPLGLPLPKSSGIYSTPASYEQICDYKTLGHIADDKNIFGKRLQLLLDARPVYGHEYFRQLRIDLLKRYATGFLEHDQRREWVYLLNDLLRYFRSYCGLHQFDLSSDPVDSWYMRNVKLRNSRIPMFAALIFLLGECSKEKQDKIGWLNSRLEMTMLERLHYVYKNNMDDNIVIFLDAYEYFMKKLNCDETRNKLVNTIPVSLDELNVIQLSEYKDLHENSKKIISELTRFTFDRRGQWSDAFFEYLLF